jgi:hypothetical protein
MWTLIQHWFTSDNLGNLSKIYFKDDNNTLGLDKLDKEFLRQVHEYARLNTAYEANKKSDKTKQE